MSKNCPLNTQGPANIKIPSVPVDTMVDIPFVPRPYSGVDYQMGGTTPSSESINNLPDNKIYQVNPPHGQNTLEPCSVTGFKVDPNSGPRKCYNIYSPGQNTIGRVCTTMGTEGPLYSREPHDGIGVNGNADWVRGNQFGVRYDDSMINDRVKYVKNVPTIKETRKTYVNYDQFYPVPDRCMQNNEWYKEYPHTKNYTETGYPTWKYPYLTTMDNSENFSNISSNINSNINSYIKFSFIDFIFWIGIVSRNERIPSHRYCLV